ncbi:hypothetical protein V8C86DRAFT_2721039, partial [Haematococcus lacustris]
MRQSLTSRLLTLRMMRRAVTLPCGMTSTTRSKPSTSASSRPSCTAPLPRVVWSTHNPAMSRKAMRSWGATTTPPGASPSLVRNDLPC